MTDLTPFKANIEKARRESGHDYIDPRIGFAEELQRQGFTPPKVMDLGKIHRIRAPDDKPGKTSGWCILQEFPDTSNEARSVGIGVYGSWKSGPERTTWVSKPLSFMSAAERADYAAQSERARNLREAELEILQHQAAKRAHKIWLDSPPADHTNPYLQRKGITAAPGVKMNAEHLIIPVCFEGEITSLQFIKNEGNFDHGSNKKFLSNGKKKGCYFEIAGTGDKIYIAEGYATAMSIFAATGNTCYVAFDAYNLYYVATHLKQKNPNLKIIIAGDDDEVGRKEALKTSDGLNVGVVFPGNQGDFNDLAVKDGYEAVQRLLNFTPQAYQPPMIAAADTSSAPGILGVLADYYNTTSGNKQPLFAIQTAIAICSVICARNYESNLLNRTNLWLLNLAKSGTGKEHAKKTVETVLRACGMSHLASNDGYTSGAAVFSALQDRPRHITVIDEFSKYLQAANNKYGNSHLMQANSQLMQAFSRYDDTMKPQNYATLGLSREKKKEMAELRVEQPAITLVAMSTPDDFFNTIDLGMIKDGFINRFIICVSDAKRELRAHKEKLDVPPSIIHWANKIEIRRGPNQENPSDFPKMITLFFTPEANKLETEFGLWCLKLQDQLEEFGLQDLPARSREMAMRLALIAALADNPDTCVIGAQHTAWAIEWIKFNLLSVVEKIKGCVSASQHEGDKKEILRALQANREGVTWTKMQDMPPFNKHKSKDLKEILQSLEEGDLIIKEPYAHGGKGRPTMIYRAISL